MTHEEIAAITATDVAAAKVVAFLKREGAHIVKSTRYGEYITASWTVQGWEATLTAEFFRFEHAGGEILRAVEYSLPAELVGLVHAVFNVVQVAILTINPKLTSVVSEHSGWPHQRVYQHLSE